jgi:nucleoside-diphosphate-sugar epimerase
MILETRYLNTKSVMPILITGGSGSVAVNLAEALLKLGEDLVLFSCHSPAEVMSDRKEGREF